METNFESDLSSGEFARMYQVSHTMQSQGCHSTIQADGLVGGHVIMLGPGNEEVRLSSQTTIDSVALNRELSRLHSVRLPLTQGDCRHPHDPVHACLVAKTLRRCGRCLAGRRWCHCRECTALLGRRRLSLNLHIDSPPTRRLFPALMFPVQGRRM